MRSTSFAGIALLTALGVGGAAAQTIRTIEVRSDAPLPAAEELLEAITVEAGDLWSDEAIARAIRSLHATGVASQIEVYREPHDDGAVDLLFVLRAPTLVDEVDWSGELVFDRWRVRDATLVRAGDPLIADRIFRSVYQLQERYAADGYLDAVVRVEVDEDRERRRAAVRFEIEPGAPTIVAGIDFEGDRGPFTVDELMQPLRTTVGDRFRRRTVRDDAERLEEWLLRRGHREAVVDDPVVTESADGMVVSYPLTVGARFEVVPSGDVRALQKRKLLPLRGDERYDDLTVAETESRIRLDYQRRGYPEPEVEVVESEEAGVRRLTVHVERGEPARLIAIDFVGNRSISDPRLRSVMQLSEPTLLTPESGKLVDGWLAEDLQSLRALYALEGFSKAQIGPPEITASAAGRSLVIPIVEGPRRLVSSLAISGADHFDPEALLEALPLEEGGPYHLRREEEALDLIRARYEAAGFDRALVSSTRETAADGSLVDIGIKVIEGPRSVVERVVVRGRRKTRPQVIRRVLDLEPGTPINRARLLELERRLYRLGIFSSVDVGLVPGTPYTSGRDVMVEVEEGLSQRLAYGIGYDSEDGVRGLLGYGHANLGGRAVSGRVDVRASERDIQARALVRQPYLGRYRTPVTYSLFHIEEEEESFRSIRNGGQVEAEWLRGPARFNLLYTYKLVEIEDPDPALQPLLIDRRFQEVTVASLSPGLTIDRRDDPVDPRRGWGATLLTELAFPMIDAEEEFGRLFAQHDRYLPLGRFGVLATSVRAGLLEPLDGDRGIDPVCLENELDAPSCRIPISERFFAGGRTTHRAYRRDSLGIPGETLLEVADGRVPFGGTGLLLANVDLRFPIAGSFGGTLFVDAGNVWGDWRAVELSDVKVGAGVGARYASPIGPVRLEIGWKLDRLPGEDPYVVLFSFGNPF